MKKQSTVVKTVPASQFKQNFGAVIRRVYEHEEILMIQEGTLEIMIEGKIMKATPGSVVVVASNDFHGWKNIGATSARYFVLAVGRP